MCGLFSGKKEDKKEVWNLIKLQKIFGSLEIVQKHKKRAREIIIK